MSKSVLISIRPEWCEKIISGEKTQEIRKTKPKLKTPFKCYIYCTLRGCPEFFRDNLDGDIAKWNRGAWGDRKGNVIGEFVCDCISPVAYTLDGLADVVDCRTACMRPSDFLRYGGGKPLYGWHISDLTIYEHPFELKEIYKPCIMGEQPDCPQCECGQGVLGWGEKLSSVQYKCTNQLLRPPQSWCYVEEVSE